MNPDRPLAVLGGLSPRLFMRRHWQKRPHLVRGAVPPPCAPLSRGELFALAARDDVQSRLVQHKGRQWDLRHGPFARRALPPLAQGGWSLLVQGVDLHVEAAHELLARFRFLPDARLDDLMISYASPGGGVGPHFDSYDVFLLQVQGRRRWRVAPPGDTSLRPGAPLKILRRFEPRDEWLLDAGDLLYLPPNWAHDGVAQDECMTCSIGFRAPGASELAADILSRVLDRLVQPEPDRLYRDAGAAATGQPARLPAHLTVFAKQAVGRLLRQPAPIERALGELMSEPKPQVVFEPGRAVAAGRSARLDRRTRLMYDTMHLFINGESHRIDGRDRRLLKRLAETRTLDTAQLSQLSRAARDLIDEWARSGWLHATSSTKEHDDGRR